MRRNSLVLATVIVAGLVMSACSVREVQVWAALHGNPTLSEASARDLADRVNRTATPGCDEWYGGCVPDNQSVVHCAGTFGEGPVVYGPIPTRWDHFGLDRDRNGIACDRTDPVGHLDVVVGGAGRIDVAGWALDGDTAEPIAVHVYDGATGRAIAADAPRPDVAALGRGTAHGFGLGWEATPGIHRVCAYAIDVSGGSNASIGCQDVTVADRPYDGSSLDRALPTFRLAAIGGGWHAEVESGEPYVPTSDSPDLGVATVRPAAGEAFLQVNVSLYCGGTASGTCPAGLDTTNIEAVVIDGRGDQFPYSSRPGAVPDLLAAPQQFQPVGFDARVWGYATFVIPTSVQAPLTMAFRVAGGPWTYFHVGDCPRWCGGLPR